MTKNIKYLSIFISIFILMSCSARLVKINNPEKIGNKLSYFQDQKTGLCFAVIAIKSDFNISQGGMSITQVPCENIKKIIKQ